MDKLIIKRLALVKHLYQQGVALSYESELTNGFYYLPFHNNY